MAPKDTKKAIAYEEKDYDVSISKGCWCVLLVLTFCGGLGKLSVLLSIHILSFVLHLKLLLVQPIGIPYETTLHLGTEGRYASDILTVSHQPLIYLTPLILFLALFLTFAFVSSEVTKKDT